MATVLRPAFGARREDEPAVPYTVVANTVLGADGLSMSLSLVLANRKTDSDEERIRRGVGTIAVGLRRDTDAAVGAIATLAQLLTVTRAANPALDPAAVFQAAGLEPVAVLARQERRDAPYTSTGLVVDGAIRVMAAVRAGMVDVPVQLVVPRYPDTPPEFLFVARNWRHGQRLTDQERDAVFRIVAQRYREAHPEERDPEAWSTWASERSSVPAAMILAAVRNVFKPLTPEQVKGLERMLRASHKAGGVTPTVIHNLAGEYGISRTAVQNRASDLGLLPKRAPKEDASKGPIDLYAAAVPKSDTRRDAATLAAMLKAAQLEAIVKDINYWAQYEAPEYRGDQAKPIWTKLTDLVYGSLVFANTCNIWEDAYEASRYEKVLETALQKIRAVLAMERSKAARRREARVLSRR